MNNNIKKQAEEFHKETIYSSNGTIQIARNHIERLLSALTESEEEVAHQTHCKETVYKAVDELAEKLSSAEHEVDIFKQFKIERLGVCVRHGYYDSTINAGECGACNLEDKLSSCEQREKELKEERDKWMAYHDFIAEECKSWREEAQEFYGQLSEKDAEIQRLRDALEFYAAEENYYISFGGKGTSITTTGTSPVDYDSGAIAKSALQRKPE